MIPGVLLAAGCGCFATVLVDCSLRICDILAAGGGFADAEPPHAGTAGASAGTSTTGGFFSAAFPSFFSLSFLCFFSLFDASISVCSVPCFADSAFFQGLGGSARLSSLMSSAGSLLFLQAIAAAAALGSDERPTELALKLDYRLRHILLDEFQDTSASQYELVRKLTRGWREQNQSDPDNPNTLFIVGDSMQPRAFPIFLMVINLALAAVLAYQIYRHPPAKVALEGYPTWGSIALLALFYPLTVHVDMFVGIAVVMFLMCLLWGERRIWVAGSLAIVTPVLVFLLFDTDTALVE